MAPPAEHGATAAAFPAGVVPAPHDISPPLDEQLVLELESRVTLGEAVDVFPRSH